jgi:hypothetical protein
MLGGMDDVIIEDALDSIEVKDGEGEICGEGNNGILKGRFKVT